ncbi:MAG: alcohol dehydrogenase catalytic domain-containing protein [Gemmatimonadetes bacterium]|jgi:threonine dehydrogenase-like Zn-dependent dehydrogenase|nr:alcohol dehydrogenase catalytic domain-containing protein [Gemmatimonadota bacterium]MBT6144297.1 alcohol dehydrogenase catalytic domain-containing protein [Gemmatimonadota bacterium]MBT7860717.1 alcohol dehydrogenase catalytic domain-containing protein [Gemmatimonadota bacterium]
MRGLWLHRGQLELRRQLDVPTPPAGEALVRVLRAGICNTDLELQRGYYPFSGILGHEFVGLVAGVGTEADSDWMGRRVVGEINAVCHDCDMCRARQPHHCRQRTVLGIVSRHGAFADYLTLPIENLHVVPDALSDDVAVYVEPVAAALQIQRQLSISVDDRVAVFGDGKLGLLIAQSLCPTGAQVTLVGHHDRKLELVAGRGIQTMRQPPTSGDYDIAIECTGSEAGFSDARACLRPQGRLVLKSTYAGQLSVDASSLVVDEIQLIGSRCGPFDEALHCLQQGLVDPLPLIEARYSLDEAVEAFQHAQRPGTLKVIIDVAGGQ